MSRRISAHHALEHRYFRQELEITEFEKSETDTFLNETLLGQKLLSERSIRAKLAIGGEASRVSTYRSCGC